MKLKDHVKVAAFCAVIWGMILGIFVHPIVGLAAAALTFFAAMFFITMTSGNHTHYGDGD